MDRTSTAILVVAAGTAIGAQAPINKELARSVGTFPAATISFAIGTALLVAIVAITGGFGGMTTSATRPGGACSAAPAASRSSAPRSSASARSAPAASRRRSSPGS